MAMAMAMAMAMVVAVAMTEEVWVEEAGEPRLRTDVSQRPLSGLVGNGPCFE